MNGSSLQKFGSTQNRVAGSCQANRLPVRHCRCKRQNRSVKVTAGLEPSSSFAIAQQAVAFAAVAGAEAAYTGTNARPNTPGVPELTPTLIGVAGTVLSAVLISSNPDVAIAGCITGVASSGFMFYKYINRIRDTPFNPEDWPGAKSWPAVMTLITFFILMAYIQGLLNA